MKRKITWISFLILLTVAAGIALYCGGPMRRRYSARGIRASLPGIIAGQTTRITIRWRDVHSTLIRKNEGWILEERGGRPASAARITALLNSLSSLNPVKELHGVTPEILQELRLVDNDPKLIPGVRVVLSDASGRELFNLLLGKGHFVRPEPGMPPSPDAEGRYVLIGGNVYLIPLVFENCHPVPSVWVEPLRLHELRKAMRMNLLRFEQGRGKLVWSVYRKSTAHPFTLAYPSAGKLAENQQLSTLADRLSRPFTSDYFIPDGKWKAVHRLRLTISCADGFTYGLDLFEGTTEYDIAALKVTFDSGKTVRIAGETEQQHQQRIRELEKRFASEKHYSDSLLFKTAKELARLLEAVPIKNSIPPAAQP